MDKVIIYMPVSVHRIKGLIIAGILKKEIDLSKDSLRVIASKIGSKDSPQQIKHHLEALVNMGTLDKINGNYFLNTSCIPFNPSKGWQPENIQ